MTEVVGHVPGIRLDEVSTREELQPLVDYFESLEAARIKSTIERSRRFRLTAHITEVEEVTDEQ